MSSRQWSRAALLVLFSGCYSFAETRRVIELSDGDREIVVDVWVSDQGCVRNGGLLLVILPLNTVMSAIFCLNAPFDDSLDIQYGAAGAVIGTLIPGFTAVPGLLPPPAIRVSLAREELDALVAAVDTLRFDQVGAIIGKQVWWWESDAARRICVRRFVK
jgi:hypothetical protein